MLSLQVCRNLVGKNCSLDDSDLELLRDQFYTLASFTLAEFEQHAKRSIDLKHSVEKALVVSPAESALRLVVPNCEKIEIEETAAIMESTVTYQPIRPTAQHSPTTLAEKKRVL